MKVHEIQAIVRKEHILPAKIPSVSECEPSPTFHCHIKPPVACIIIVKYLNFPHYFHDSGRQLAGGSNGIVYIIRTIHDDDCEDDSSQEHCNNIVIPLYMVVFLPLRQF